MGGFIGEDQAGASTINNSFYADTPTQCTNLAGACSVFGTSVDTSAGTGIPNYFFNNTINPPLNAWDFTNEWSVSPGALPLVIF